MLVTFDDLKNLYGFNYLNENLRQSYEEALRTAEEEVLAFAGISNGARSEQFPAGATRCTLTHHPVLSISGVTVSGAAVSDYVYDQDTRTIVLQSPASGTVAVSFTCGYAQGQTPGALRRAIAATVRHWMNLDNGNLIGVNSRTSDAGNVTIEQAEIPTHVKSLLSRFRNEVFL